MIDVEKTPNASIMIVDDNTNLNSMMARILNRKGYDVITANDGLEAIEKAKENIGIDVVFMDIKMPLMNGVETYKQLKKIRPDTVVIMMTAYAVEDLIQEALEEGAFGILYKPLEFNDVLMLIEKANSNNTGALVMIVDDDKGTRNTFKAVLEKKGFTVVTAENGEKAIERAQENHFDVIFIDMQLPTINGLETYLRIKEIRPNAVAVMITGFYSSLADLVDQAVISSAYTCLNKPVDMSVVFKLLDDIISRKRGENT
jgi:DNA-binding NtrC family response regulator